MLLTIVVVVVVDGYVEGAQLVRQQAAADGVGPVGAGHDTTAGLSSPSARHRVVPDIRQILVVLGGKVNE